MGSSPDSYPPSELTNVHSSRPHSRSPSHIWSIIQPPQERSQTKRYKETPASDNSTKTASTRAEQDVKFVTIKGCFRDEGKTRQISPRIGYRRAEGSRSPQRRTDRYYFKVKESRGTPMKDIKEHNSPTTSRRLNLFRLSLSVFFPSFSLLKQPLQTPIKHDRYLAIRFSHY